jgi:NADH-quinone oxidoreductase subunit L
MKYEVLPWVILFLPLVAAGIITLFTLKNEKVSATLSVGAIVVGFLATALCFRAFRFSPQEFTINWLDLGALQVDFGLRLDPLSLMMLFVVTGVGSLIHIYSIGYMKGDPGFSRFFACLSLFTFSMLGIVLSNNFLQMFIFWELVGVSSYLLIGFWFEKASAADASKKAFLTNRVGDFGFMLGILILWVTFHNTLNFELVQQYIRENPALVGGGAMTIAGLLIFCGAVGKSAQFPLHVWLPDAMEGPTPVSALIHAATMVAAGVYMLCRVFFIFTPDALTVISWVGGFTALLAALIAVQQNDIKRILAYSTLSQLGYMVMGVGLHSPEAGMFHLTTHAFFKALLFLGAGSVIHAMHHEQDIWKMGALAKKMPVTFRTFIIGTLALAGFPGLSGFYSKDAILAAAHHHSLPLFILGVGVSALTTFYMFRLVFVTFFGSAKSHSVDHAHESPGVMIWPLILLAVPSVIGGVIGIEALFANALKPGGEHPHGVLALLVYPFKHAPVAALSGFGAFVVGLLLAWRLYWNAKEDVFTTKFSGLSKLMSNRFYFDEIYEATVIRIHDGIAAVANFIDRWIVEGFCIGLVRGGTDLTGRALRLVQTGNIQTYAFLFVLGVALVLWFVLGK